MLFRSVYCERLAELVARRLDGLRLSMGVAQTGPEHYDDPDALIRRADTAMYEAKRLAKARAEAPAGVPITPVSSVPAINGEAHL